MQHRVDIRLDTNEYLIIELSPDGINNWTTVFFWTHGAGDDNIWHEESLDLSSYIGATNFSMRIGTQTSNGSEHVHVDDIRITAE